MRAAFLHFALGALTTILSTAQMNPSMAQDIPTGAAAAGGLQIRFSSIWSKESQQETSQTQPGTTQGWKHLLAVSKAISPETTIGIDFSRTTMVKTTDRLAPGFTEHAHLGKESIEANTFAVIERFGLTIRPSIRLGFDEYQLDRPDTTLTQAMGRSRSSGFHVGTNLEVSTVLPLSDRLFLRPIADIDYSYLTVDPFSETGLGLYGADFDRIIDERTTSQIGLAVATRLPLGEQAWITPFIQARYRHNFNTQPITTNAAIKVLNMQKNVVLSTAEEADGLILDTGVFLAGAGGWEAMAVYEGKFFPSLIGHTISGHLKISF